jgi:retron-type reverse transcriptase
LERVREKAKEDKKAKFTALLHHLTVDLLRASFQKLQKKAAPGVDGVRWKEYAQGLEERLADLHSRVHRGAYRAQPSRRVYLPKPDGRQRPLGIAALGTRLFNRPWWRYSMQFMRTIFLGSHTGSDLGAVRTTP